MKKIFIFMLFLVFLGGTKMAFAWPGELYPYPPSAYGAQPFNPLELPYLATHHVQTIQQRDIEARHAAERAYKDMVNSFGFGFNKDMLRRLIFNVVNTSYYNTIVGAIGKVSYYGEGSSDPAITAAVEQYDGAVSGFRSLTGSYSVDMGMTATFYDKPLIASFGNIKTSLLKDVGVGINNDVSYNTIMANFNQFLLRVTKNQSDLNYFNAFFGKDFSFTDVRNNHIPSANISSFSWANDMKYYDKPSLHTVNFFSLTYYTFKNIYYGTAAEKRNASKLLKDIIFKNYKNADNLF